VLTEGSFLHAFKAKVAHKGQGDEVPFSWTKNPAFNGGKEEEGGNKEGEDSSYFNLWDYIEDLTPVFSIDLRGASIRVSQENVNMHSFLLTSTTPKGLFGKETKHLIKASSEEEMVDWFVAIKAKILPLQTEPTPKQGGRFLPTRLSLDNEEEQEGQQEGEKTGDEEAAHPGQEQPEPEGEHQEQQEQQEHQEQQEQQEDQQ